MSNDDIGALERELAQVDARREPILARLRAARATEAVKPRIVFDAATAGHADPHYRSTRWPSGWQKFEASPSSVLEVLVERLIYSPGEIPRADAESIDRSPYRRTVDSHRCVASKGDRVTVASHLAQDLIAAGHVRRSPDQDSPPSEPRWSPVPWQPRQSAAAEALSLGPIPGRPPR